MELKRVSDKDADIAMEQAAAHLEDCGFVSVLILATYIPTDRDEGAMLDKHRGNYWSSVGVAHCWVNDQRLKEMPKFEPWPEGENG